MRLKFCPTLNIVVDQDRSRNGRFILTGSQVFTLMAGVSETLAGRVALFELLGFSWSELDKAMPHSASACFRQIHTGFYPEPAAHRVSTRNFYASYLQTYLERDIRQIQSVQDLVLFQHFLELLATRVGGLLNLNEIAKECGISHPAARRWLSLLESTRIVYLLRPYFRNISTRVVKSPKVYFTDTGLLSFLLKYPDERTLRSGPVAGQMFENMVILEVLKEKMNHSRLFEMYFLRDSNHNELDLILEAGGKNILAEIKMTKTLRPEFVKAFKPFRPIFSKSQSCLISFAAEELRLSQKVRNVPWWSLNRIFQRGS